MRKKNCVEAETEIYKIQKQTYIEDFQVIIRFYRNSLMNQNKYVTYPYNK